MSEQNSIINNIYEKLKTYNIIDNLMTEKEFIKNYLILPNVCHDGDKIYIQQTKQKGQNIKQDKKDQKQDKKEFNKENFKKIFGYEINVEININELTEYEKEKIKNLDKNLDKILDKIKELLSLVDKLKITKEQFNLYLENKNCTDIDEIKSILEENHKYSLINNIYIILRDKKIIDDNVHSQNYREEFVKDYLIFNILPYIEIENRKFFIKENKKPEFKLKFGIEDFNDTFLEKICINEIEIKVDDLNVYKEFAGKKYIPFDELYSIATFLDKYSINYNNLDLIHLYNKDALFYRDFKKCEFLFGDKSKKLLIDKDSGKINEKGIELLKNIRDLKITKSELEYYLKNNTKELENTKEIKALIEEQKNELKTYIESIDVQKINIENDSELYYEELSDYFKDIFGGDYIEINDKFKTKFIDILKEINKIKKNEKKEENNIEYVNFLDIAKFAYFAFYSEYAQERIEDYNSDKLKDVIEVCYLPLLAKFKKENGIELMIDDCNIELKNKLEEIINLEKQMVNKLKNNKERTIEKCLYGDAVIAKQMLKSFENENIKNLEENENIKNLENFITNSSIEEYIKYLGNTEKLMDQELKEFKKNILKEVKEEFKESKEKYNDIVIQNDINEIKNLIDQKLEYLEKNTIEIGEIMNFLEKIKKKYNDVNIDSMKKKLIEYKKLDSVRNDYIRNNRVKNDVQTIRNKKEELNYMIIYKIQNINFLIQQIKINKQSSCEQSINFIQNELIEINKFKEAQNINEQINKTASIADTFVNTFLLLLPKDDENKSRIFSKIYIAFFELVNGNREICIDKKNNKKCVNNTLCVNSRLCFNDIHHIDEKTNALFIEKLISIPKMSHQNGIHVISKDNDFFIKSIFDKFVIADSLIEQINSTKGTLKDILNDTEQKEQLQQDIKNLKLIKMYYGVIKIVCDNDVIKNVKKDIINLCENITKSETSISRNSAADVVSDLKNKIEEYRPTFVTNKDISNQQLFDIFDSVLNSFQKVGKNIEKRL